MIWMILGASVPGVVCLLVGLSKLSAARREKAAADLCFAEAGMKLLFAEAKIERAEALCKYAAKCLEVGRQHNARARELMNGEGGEW